MRYHNITKDDMLNGDGLRVVLWVAGCEHHCPNCQNPVTWDINGGLEFDEAAKKEIFDELEKNYVSGITFSGGDPLHTQKLIIFQTVHKFAVHHYVNIFHTRQIFYILPIITVSVNKGTGFCQGIFVEYGITFDDDVTDERNGGFGSTGM